ncbi:MAG: EpsI family protein [candidate division Zixibacteria bacterium]|nr:EpsI family protein [candidate division Zixibacteria bacterium]
MKTEVILACVLIVVGGALANVLRFSEQMPDRPAMFDQIPYDPPGYVGEERYFSEQSYDVLQADTTTLRVYYDSLGNAYWLFVAYFANQKYGSQIHSPKNCLPGGGWRIEKLEPYTVELGGGVSRYANRVTITDLDQSQIMLYWFETRGGVIREEFGLKWDLMKNSLLFRPTDAAFIRLSLPRKYNETVEECTERAVRYLKTAYPYVQRALPFGQ